MSPKPRVCLVSPALADANNGNWHTASRWARLLGGVASVQIVREWAGDPADAMIALHARRSAASIARFHEAAPDAPLAVVMTGTDLYRDLEVDASARHSLQCASHVVVLQEAGLAALPAAARAKARCIEQSATQVLRSVGRAAADGAARGADASRAGASRAGASRADASRADARRAGASRAGADGTSRSDRSSGQVGLVAVGHLRDEKDPLTLIAAARLLPGTTPIRIHHIGAALDPALGQAATHASQACDAYRWLGAREAGAARRWIARSHALVHMSRMEGGANVVIEAIRSRVPVLASRIDGNLGLLGADYLGYFPVGDAPALAALMQRFVAEPAFAEALRAQCRAREPRFEPAAERRAVRGLLADMLPDRRRRAP